MIILAYGAGAFILALFFILQLFSVCFWESKIEKEMMEELAKVKHNS